MGLNADFISTMKDHTLPQQSQNKMEDLLSALEREEFDLVAVGRALLADPNWPQKMRENRLEDIVPFSQGSLATLS